MCGGNCPSQMANLTPQQLLEFTYARFKLSVLSLMVLVSAFLFYNIYFHSVTMPVLIFSLVYITVLNIGLRGATMRSTRLLRFYWVFQLVQVIVFLLTVLALVVLAVYVHASMLKSHPHAVQPEIVQPKVMHDTVVLDGAQASKQAAEAKPMIATQEIQPQTQQSHMSGWMYLTTGVFIPAVIVFIVVFAKTRSIVLARQLIAVIESLEESGDIELVNSCCEKENECCQEEKKADTKETEMVPVNIYSPEAVYVVPQAYDAAYPGQLMPVYVDKFGQPLRH